MKRYLVFAWGNYYPLGGLFDFIFDFDDKTEAEIHLNNYLVGKRDSPYYNEYSSGGEGCVLDVSTKEVVIQAEMGSRSNYKLTFNYESVPLEAYLSKYREDLEDTHV